jgi:hypothetical protein
MRGRLGIDVIKSNDVFILINDLCRYLFIDDFAKKGSPCFSLDKAFLAV